jgi:hypothetical protein
VVKKLTKKEKRTRIAEIQKALSEIAVGRCFADHAFNGRGGAGLSAFVWVTFDNSLSGDKRRHLVKFCVGSNSVDCSKVENEVSKIKGYVGHYINLD